MDYLELRKRKVFRKYQESDIFNTKAESNQNKSYHYPKYKSRQQSLIETKNDIFNTTEKNINFSQTKRKINTLNYKSDIFNLREQKNKKSCQRININYSTCFNGLKNNEEYRKDLIQYSKTHRPLLKEYEADKYVYKESALDRYYKNLYGDEKNDIFLEKKILNKTMQNPEKNINNNFQGQIKNFEKRKRNLKRSLVEINDCGADGKRRPGEHMGQETDNKGNKIMYNKKKIDIYGHSTDSRNNRKLIKEKNNFKFNNKLKKQ